MGKKKKVANVQAEVAPADDTQSADTSVPTLAEHIAAIPEPDPRPKKKRKGVSMDGVQVATLADLSAAYLAHMENEGRSEGTVDSYRMELRTAMSELDCDTPLQEITPERVQAFFDCKRVTKLRSGKNKSQLSIDKTRRVLRLALVWAAERGIIKSAPLPELVSA